jgi:hypothetical protein
MPLSAGGVDRLRMKGGTHWKWKGVSNLHKIGICATKMYHMAFETVRLVFLNPVSASAKLTHCFSR